eukprot:6183925-Pleurochrysis_carterae.AAC.1
MQLPLVPDKPGTEHACEACMTGLASTHPIDPAVVRSAATGDSSVVIKSMSIAPLRSGPSVQQQHVGCIVDTPPGSASGSSPRLDGADAVQ